MYDTDDINHFLNTLSTPKLSTSQIIFCDIESTEKGLYDSIKSMENGKSREDDSLTMKLYVTTKDDIKVNFISFLK